MLSESSSVPRCSLGKNSAYTMYYLVNSSSVSVICFCIETYLRTSKLLHSLHCVLNQDSINLKYSNLLTTQRSALVYILTN